MNTSPFDEKEINKLRKRGEKERRCVPEEVQRQKRAIDDLQPSDDTNTLGLLLVPSIVAVRSVILNPDAP